MPAQEPTSALGEAIRDRREQLGMTQEQLSAETKRVDERGKGLSPRAIGAYERGEIQSMHFSSMEILDAALEWPPGTVRAMLHGSPLPSDSGPVSARLDELESQVADLRSDIADLIDYHAARERLAVRRQHLSLPHDGAPPHRVVADAWPGRTRL